METIVIKIGKLISFMLKKKKKIGLDESYTGPSPNCWFEEKFSEW